MKGPLRGGWKPVDKKASPLLIDRFWSMCARPVHTVSMLFHAVDISRGRFRQRRLAGQRSDSGATAERQRLLVLARQRKCSELLLRTGKAWLAGASKMLTKHLL